MNAIKNGAKLARASNLELVRKFQTAGNQSQSQVAAAAALERDEVRSEWETAKPFNSIPGPKPLPIPYIGNLWRLMPFGTYGKMDLADVHQRLYDEYGPIVRLSKIGKFEQVVLFEPNDIEKMFRNESNWPLRIGLNSMEYYRTVVRKDFYQGVQGLVTSQGEEWQRFRTATNQTMMQPKNVKVYMDPMANVIDDFIERIRLIRGENQEMPENFLEEINKVALESFAVVTLDTRLGCLKPNLSPDSEAMRMINNVKEVMALMHILDFTPSPWKYISTPTYKKFVTIMDDILDIAFKYVNTKWEMIKKQSENEDRSSKSVLETLLLKTKDPKIPIVMAIDTIMAGIDTTSNTLGTILYMLSINPEKQEKLYQELKALLPKKDTKITDDIFNQLKYTRAVIKESMRMRPTTIGNQRTAAKDLVLSNYQIPKGTQLLASHLVICRMEKYFKDVDKFIPERWLKSESKSDISSKNTSPFVFLPFGFGQRSCIGRRFAELEMDLALTKIIRNFKVSYHHEPMTWGTRLVMSPNKPLKFKMEDRPE